MITLKADPEILARMLERLNLRVVEVAWDPATRNTVLPSESVIPLDSVEKDALRFSGPWLKDLMRSELGHIFLFEWEPLSWVEGRLPPNIVAGGRTLLSSGDKFLYTRNEEGKVAKIGLYDMIVDNKTRRVTLAYIVKA